MPATRLPLPGWRSHIGSGGKRSSEFWAQLRLAEACQPHQKPDTPAPCPRPLPTHPPACPAGQHSHPGCCTLRLPGPGPPPPHPPGLCPLGQAHSGGAQAPAHGRSRPQRGSSERGRRQGGRERELVLLLVSAPRAGAKNRGGEIFRRSQDAFGRSEGEREREEGRREGGKRGGGRERGGLSFQIHARGAAEGQPPGVGGTQGRPGSGGDGLGPTRTAHHPHRPGQDSHRQKPRSMHTGQTEGGLWAAQTHTRTSPHNGLLSTTGQGHGQGPLRGHHGCPASREATGRPACSQPRARPPRRAFHTMVRGRERNSCGATHSDGPGDKAQDAQCHGGETPRHGNDMCTIQVDTSRHAGPSTRTQPFP